jgi:hypothetical protein
MDEHDLVDVLAAGDEDGAREPVQIPLAVPGDWIVGSVVEAVRSL